MSEPGCLPASMVFIERDWLSSNQVMFFDRDQATLIDSGYDKHLAMTRALTDRALAQHPGSRLTRLFNTHLHSDHCGGNATLVRHHGCAVHVPAASFDVVNRWDQSVLTFEGTGQHCDPFQASAAIEPGTTLKLGDMSWQALVRARS